MKTVQSQKIYKVVCFTFILAGAFLLRFQYFSNTDYPLNDGGLFYQMTRELIDNGFRFPVFTAYNQSQIPFAYPPFGLYLSGGISQLSGLDLLVVFRWLPLIINLIALPFVFLLADKLLGNFTAGLTAAGLWAFSLPSYEYLIMGGGITRSPGYTASIIGIFFFVLYLKTENKWHFLIAILFGGITALSHLEIFSVHVLSILVLAFIVKKPLRKSAAAVLIYLLGCAVISTPYVITVILNHGLTPFLSASGSVNFSPAPGVVRLFLFNFSKEYSLTITAVLGVIGFIAQVLRRKPGLLVWLGLMILADPSNADRSALLPLTFLAAIGFHEVLFPALVRIRKGNHENTEVQGGALTEFSALSSVFLFLYILLLAFFRFYAQDNRWNSITTTDIQAFRWIESNTSPEATFLLLPHKYSWQHDGVSEWFPALTQRKSVLTVQGAEWQPNDYHEHVENLYTNFHDCFESGCDCLTKTLSQLDKNPDYLWISKNEWPAKTSACIAPLVTEAQSESQSPIVFQNDDIMLLYLK